MLSFIYFYMLCYCYIMHALCSNYFADTTVYMYIYVHVHVCSIVCLQLVEFCACHTLVNHKTWYCLICTNFDSSKADAWNYLKHFAIWNIHICLFVYIMSANTSFNFIFYFLTYSICLSFNILLCRFFSSLYSE